MNDNARVTRDYRRLIVQAGALAVFALTPLWYRLPQPLPVIEPLYVTRFVVFLVAALTVGVWLFSGAVGLGALLRDRTRAVWALALLALAVWMWASGSWAFMGERYPEIARSASLQMTISALFALAVASVGVPGRAVVIVLGFGVAWNAGLAMAQVAVQGSVGGVFALLGEFPLRVEQAGISYLQAGDMRWLRPYGLLPHPNVLGGFLVVSTLATVYGLGAWRGWRWGLALIVFCAGLWALLLTFSRGGWLGFGVAAIAFLPVLARLGLVTRRLWIAVGVAMALSGVFVASYHPLILARAGVGSENVEQFSIGERILLEGAALVAIRENPLTGVGAGNFPWRASYYFFDNDIPLRGNNVHRYLLSAWAETGLIGMVLVVAAMIAGYEAALRAIYQRGADAGARALLLAGWLGLVITGMVDHYTWTLPQMQLLWWGCLAVALGDKGGVAHVRRA